MLSPTLAIPPSPNGIAEAPQAHKVWAYPVAPTSTTSADQGST
jgi:hypothetical protein